MVFYNGLTKAEVLCALYNNARCQGFGFLHYEAGNMAVERAEELLKVTTDFDYLYGRVLKVDLSGHDGFDEWLYDRDNGNGAAQCALDEYRKSKNQSAEDVYSI